MDEENGTPAPVEQDDFKQKFEDQQRRAEKAENELKEIKDALEAAASQEEQTQEPLTAQGNPVQFDSLAENLSVLRNLDDDEVAELQTEAKSLGVDPVKFAKSSAWKAQLETLRANKQEEQQTPEPSHRTAVYEGKTFADVVHEKDATPQQRQAAFEAQRDAILKRGRNQMI